MKYKLFACDLDETLLNDEHLVPQVNADAVRRAREEFGLKIVPCTGRGYKTTECELKALGLYGLKNEYVLSYNGSCLTENAGYREQFFHALPYETVCKIADAAKDFDVCIEFYTVDMIYIYRLNEDERCRKIGQNAAFTEIFDLDLSFLKDIPVAKVLLEKVDMPYLFSLKPKMLPIVGDICSITFSAGRFMEIITAGIDKGVGLSLLSQKLDIPLSEIMAAGDNYNDIPMLQKAGLSVCPANAVDEVKAVCNYVAKADNNAGAIAEALENLFFGGIKGMITPITGSFFEFEHPNLAEGKYINPALASFAEEDLRAQISDLAALGIDTLVLLATALRERAYYSGSIFPQPEHFFCKQPL